LQKEHFSLAAVQSTVFRVSIRFMDADSGAVPCYGLNAMGFIIEPSIYIDEKLLLLTLTLKLNFLHARPKAIVFKRHLCPKSQEFQISCGFSTNKKKTLLELPPVFILIY